MKIKNIYNDYFFSNQSTGSYNSAKAIAPLVLEIIEPKNIVDIGCGLGSWLKVFSELGVSEILGLDGDYIDLNKLYIPKTSFLAHNLEEKLFLNKRYDLAISLEVAEHIRPKKAKLFINNLVSHSDIILFSAAIPGQADKEIGHINEQWPEYWQELFKGFNYILLDPFRSKIFNNNKIDWWYRQNLMLVVKNSLLKKKKFACLPVYNRDLKIIHQSILDKYKKNNNTLK
jgi:23S rRNA U2552 (ribose-2'-O)-methylase RlmE/FtsJ